MLGLGTGSQIWEGFVDPETRRSVYSVELARSQFYNEMEMMGIPEADIQPSNITFGDANNQYYIDNNVSSVYIVANPNYTYSVTNFTYGIIYRDNVTNEATSQYFYQLGTDQYSVEFNINYKGMGIPANYFSELQALLEYTTGGNITCDSTIGGHCELPG